MVELKLELAEKKENAQVFDTCISEVVGKEHLSWHSKGRCTQN